MNMLKPYYRKASAAEDVQSVAVVTPIGQVEKGDAVNSFE